MEQANREEQQRLAKTIGIGSVASGSAFKHKLRPRHFYWSKMYGIVGTALFLRSPRNSPNCFHFDERVGLADFHQYWKGLLEPDCDVTDETEHEGETCQDEEGAHHFLDRS